MNPKFLNRAAKVKNILKYITSSSNWKFTRWNSVCIQVRNDKKTSEEKKEKILRKLYVQLITTGKCSKADQRIYLNIIKTSKRDVEDHRIKFVKGHIKISSGFRRLVKWKWYRNYLKRYVLSPRYVKN